MGIEIRLETLRKGPHKVREPIEPATLTERLAATYRLNDVPFVVHATSTLYTNVVEVKGHIVGSLSYECSRCGETKAVGINTPFQHSFVPHGELDIRDADDVENSLDDNIDVSEHDGHSVQLEPIALEHFLVELPYAPTCETGGLSPCKGVNLEKVNAAQGSLPEHPFHAALKKLKLPSNDSKN